MALIRYRLGDLIELSELTNNDNQYTIENVKGASIRKVFIETKANMAGVSLKPYLVVKPEYFAYVPITSRNGNKITIAFNNTDDTYIVSSSYIVFYVKKVDVIDPRFLFMFFNRPEFDRYARFNSWGSAREAFSWESMQEVEIDLPDICIQKKYVAVFEALNISNLDEVSRICPILMKGAVEEGKKENS